MKTTISDMRPGWRTNIHIEDDKPYFNGSRIQELIKDDSTKRQNHLYQIVQYGTIVSSIALTDEDFKTIDDLLHPIEFTRVNSDANGNPRFVCHFLNFTCEADIGKSLDEKYNIALSRAKEFGGRKFHNKQYGGGIVFQMYDGQRLQMSVKIKEFMSTIKSELV